MSSNLGAVPTKRSMASKARSTNAAAGSLADLEQPRFAEVEARLALGVRHPPASHTLYRRDHTHL